MLAVEIRVFIAQDGDHDLAGHVGLEERRLAEALEERVVAPVQVAVAQDRRAPDGYAVAHVAHAGRHRVGHVGVGLVVVAAVNAVAVHELLGPVHDEVLVALAVGRGEGEGVLPARVGDARIAAAHVPLGAEELPLRRAVRHPGQAQIRHGEEVLVVQSIDVVSE